MKRFRTATLVAGVLLVIAATATEIGIGTFCSICPVGFLQVSAASRSVPTGMIAGVIVVLLLAFALGRMFCAWLCPSALIKSKKKAEPAFYVKSPRLLRNMPYIILAVSLLASFAVGFPVFCLICPIGLFFGFIFAVFKMFHIYEPSWNLIIFPAILAIELILFKKWCAYICPIGGIFALMRKIPLPKFGLKANGETCLTLLGKKCHACMSACPEGLDVTKSDNTLKERCTLCLECKEHCPTKSIQIKTQPR